MSGREILRLDKHSNSVGKKANKKKVWKIPYSRKNAIDFIMQQRCCTLWKLDESEDSEEILVKFEPWVQRFYVTGQSDSYRGSDYKGVSRNKHWWQMVRQTNFRWSLFTTERSIEVDSTQLRRLQTIMIACQSMCLVYR